VRDKCGGCQLQHLSYDAQLAAKGRIIADGITRIGKRDVQPPEVAPSPQQWRYRRKLTLALRRRGSSWVAGLHPYDDPGRVFRLEDCPITDRRVLDAWREILDSANDLPDAPSLRGAVRLSGEDISCVIEGGRAWAHSSVFFQRVRSLSSLWWIGDGKPRRLLHRRESEQAPGASFAQVNADVAASLRQRVLELVMSRQPMDAIDAYAGLGDLAQALAERGVRTTAIELDPEAVAWCARRLPSGSRAIAGRAEQLMPEALPADVVILNPPRTGIDATLADELERTDIAPKAVIYVSCNPSTLARDLARMPRYRIATLSAFDMFPQTAHVETVCELVPEAA
jgi:23S rRNA (uracil1939-C5)-methyltransferase